MMRGFRLMLPFAAALAGIMSAAPTFAAQEPDKTTGEEVAQEVSEAIDAIKSYTIEQRDEALQQARIITGELDARIERQEENLRRQWDQMNESAREQASTTLSRLRQRRNELAEWYGGLQHGSGRAWEDIKVGFSDAYSDLRAAWEDAAREFETEE